MADWACGVVHTTGTKAAVLAFSKRFITEDEPTTIKGTRYFARTFLTGSRNYVEKEIEKRFLGYPPSEERCYTFAVSFAWSANCCLVDGYPQKFSECITLADACTADHVDVDIRTEEIGAGFEENIHCSRSGIVEMDVQSMKEIRCRHCGSTQYLPSCESIGEAECQSCGLGEFDFIEEEAI